MADTVMDDAVALLNTDPLLRAARDITVAAMRGGFEDDPKVAAAAAVIVASRAPAQTTYTFAESYDLICACNRRQSELAAAREVVALWRAQLDRDLDPDARAAAQGALNEACRRLDSLLPRTAK